MKKLDTKKLIEVNHIWDDPNDRWIFQAKCEDGYIYYNYCQGCDYDEFLKNYTKPDYGLSEFLNMELTTSELQGNPTQEVSRMIWLYANATMCYESYK